MPLTTELQKSKIQYTPPAAKLDDLLLKKELVKIVKAVNDAVGGLTLTVDNSPQESELAKIKDKLTLLISSLDSLVSRVKVLEDRASESTTPPTELVQFLLPLNLPGTLVVETYQVGFGLSGTRVDGNLILNGDVYIYGS
jgi:hypothetical protein